MPKSPVVLFWKIVFIIYALSTLALVLFVFRSVWSWVVPISSVVWMLGMLVTLIAGVVLRKVFHRNIRRSVWIGVSVVVLVASVVFGIFLSIFLLRIPITELLRERPPVLEGKVLVAEIPRAVLRDYDAHIDPGASVSGVLVERCVTSRRYGDYIYRVLDNGEERQYSAEGRSLDKTKYGVEECETLNVAEVLPAAIELPELVVEIRDAQIDRHLVSPDSIEQSVEVYLCEDAPKAYYAVRYYLRMRGAPEIYHLNLLGKMLLLIHPSDISPGYSFRDSLRYDFLTDGSYRCDQISSTVE
jgi:hypothetical protein